MSLQENINKNVMTKSKKDYLTIDRSKWRTGSVSNCKSGNGPTQLLNSEGYMCCLGFRCYQMGIPKKDLLDIPIPQDLSDTWDIPDLVDEFGYNSNFACEAMSINDTNEYTREEREEKIKEHFANIGITVEFTGKYK